MPNPNSQAPRGIVASTLTLHKTTVQAPSPLDGSRRIPVDLTWTMADSNLQIIAFGPGQTHDIMERMMRLAALATRLIDPKVIERELQQ